MSINPSSIPLSAFEIKARDHAHIMFFAYLVGLPIGVWTARYLRTFFSGWLFPHAIVNGLFVGPLILAGYALGYQTTTTSGLPHFNDPHTKMGLVLFILYLAQVLLGVFIHWVKIPRTWTHLLGHRPQNIIHVMLGLTILALASYQTHYGLYTEWGVITGNIHPVTIHCKRFWLAFVIITWSIYLGGLVFLGRQFKQERRALAPKYADSNEGKTPIAQQDSPTA